MLWLAITFSIVIFSLVILFVVMYRKKKCTMEKKGKTVCGDFSRRKRPKLIKALFIFGIVILSIVATLGIINVSFRLAYIRSVEGTAEWKVSDGQDYLEIQADDYYSLGYLEGKELASEIRTVWLAVHLQLDSEYKELYDDYYDKFTELPDYEDYVDEMQGIADGASQANGLPITFKDIFMQNIFLDLRYGHIKVDGYLGEMGCTAIASKNDNGTITLGQNFDLEPDFAPVLSWVSHKVGDNPRVFSLRFGGILSAPIMMNEYGVKCLVNMVETNKTSDEVAVPAAILSRYAIERATTKDELFNYMLRNGNGYHKITSSFNLIMADNESFVGLQCLSGGNIRNRTGNRIVQTNRFVEQNGDWNGQYFAKGNYSLSRQQHAEQLLQSKTSDENLSNEELIEILSEKTQLEGESQSEICRTNESYSITLAFMTQNNFGIGNPCDNPIGTLPI